MKKPQKSAKIDPFFALDKDRQTFVALTVNENLTNKELAVQVNRKREATMSEWKKSDWYEPARDAYIRLSIKGDYKVEALKTLLDLLDAKSEMVRLQAATTLLKMAGMLSDNDTPELTRAKVRKANAEADKAEIEKKQLQDSGTAGITKIVFSDDLKPDKEDDSKQKGSEDNGTDTKPK
ncbi:helix-turn-helix domain-containing protein [Limosilactobacillus reuteri]|uniref:helix-turn-helix domain-containing protein n=1 Tax=Limosilactobacillus reuteri TaxID=1598 RepID=UPI003F684F03